MEKSNNLSRSLMLGAFLTLSTAACAIANQTKLSALNMLDVTEDGKQQDGSEVVCLPRTPEDEEAINKARNLAEKEINQRTGETAKRIINSMTLDDITCARAFIEKDQA